MKNKQPKQGGETAPKPNGPGSPSEIEQNAKRIAKTWRDAKSENDKTKKKVFFEVQGRPSIHVAKYRPNN